MEKQRLNIFLAILLLAQIFFLKWISNNIDLVENCYSAVLYPFISNISRFFFNLFSFSVGDVFYTLLAIYIIYNLYKVLKKKKLFKFETSIKLLAFLSVILFLFNFLWGFNYYRKPLSQQLNIEKTLFTTEELEEFAIQLITDINKIQHEITQNDSLKVIIPYNKDSIYQLSVEGYLKLNSTYPFLRTPNLKVKNSLFSTPLSYMGFAGYLNPFTNEAQVNSKIPLVSLIATSCHEIGHQVGFGAEYEANMLSYLVAVNHDNMYFQYAGKFMALRYTLNELYLADENLYQKYFSTINNGIIKNMEESQVFWEQYQNPLEPFFKAFYDIFLKSNAQKEGIKSYKKVVGLMINYQQKSK
ncbi:MAG: DUF3810 domain-containing protein [Flavobacteriaceae bacterium]|nr:DUF3810 domain-containing protein [Flavobacteriaceae bacterium]